MSAALTAAQKAARRSDRERLTGWNLALTCAAHTPEDHDLDGDFDDLCDDDFDDDDALVPLADENAEDIDEDAILATGDDSSDLLDPTFAPEARLLDRGEDRGAARFRIGAQLGSLSVADASGGSLFLREYDPRFDPTSKVCERDQIYLSQSQEANRHDRLMMDIGGGRGGTHGTAPEDRESTRSLQIVNQSLVCHALIQIPGEDDVHHADVIEREEAEAFYLAANARLAKKSAYVLHAYPGKPKKRQVLALFLQSMGTKEIAGQVGLCSRRIQQICYGAKPVPKQKRNAEIGLRQICREITANGVPAEFQSAPPVLVQPIKSLRKSLKDQSVVAQLGWDFDAMLGVQA